MVTFACREIRGGGLIKFFYSYFILAPCESREDFFRTMGTVPDVRFFVFSEKRTRGLRAHREGMGEARKMIWDFIFTRAKINKFLV